MNIFQSIYWQFCLDFPQYYYSKQLFLSVHIIIPNPSKYYFLFPMNFVYENLVLFIMISMDTMHYHHLIYLFCAHFISKHVLSQNVMLENADKWRESVILLELLLRPLRNFRMESNIEREAEKERKRKYDGGERRSRHTDSSIKRPGWRILSESASLFDLFQFSSVVKPLNNFQKTPYLSMPTYKLTYFDVRGYAEPARILFHLAGVPFEDKRITHGDGTWEKLKDSELIETLFLFN